MLLKARGSANYLFMEFASSDSNGSSVGMFRSEITASLRKDQLESMFFKKRLKLMGMEQKTVNVGSKDNTPAKLRNKLFLTAKRSPGQLTQEVIEVLEELKSFSADIDNHSAGFYHTFIEELFLEMSIEGLRLDDSSKQNTTARGVFLWIWVNLSVCESPHLLDLIWNSGLVTEILQLIQRTSCLDTFFDATQFLSHILRDCTVSQARILIDAQLDEIVPTAFSKLGMDADPHYLMKYSNYMRTVFSDGPAFMVSPIEHHFKQALMIIVWYAGYGDQESIDHLLPWLFVFLRQQDSFNLGLATEFQAARTCLTVLKLHQFRQSQTTAAKILLCLLKGERHVSVAEVGSGLSRKSCSYCLQMIFWRVF